MAQNTIHSKFLVHWTEKKINPDKGYTIQFTPMVFIIIVIPSEVLDSPAGEDKTKPKDL